MSPSSPLICAGALRQALQDGSVDVLVLDCRFDLADPSAGQRRFDAGHIPGARHVHLDDTLSGPKTGRNGRHPLPERVAFAQAMAALGANAGTLVVAYDDAFGIFAARLWWLLRWAGHANAAVLDGGLAAWQGEKGFGLESGPAPQRPPGDFALRDSLVAQVDFDAVRANLDSGARLVIDARAPDRFRGENETLDPVGGHIPGARNRHFRDNLDADGRFKPADVLRAEFAALAASRPASELVSQCGSGVTACHNLLALEVAGLPGAALYAGSWSEWCARPDAPVAAGSAG